ncbi:MAG: class I SAM-dependent methyltransferase, partial [Algoriphagus sp.]
MSVNYPGQELELFENAKNWKSYFSHKINPYISGDVLEVGAGIGGTTPYLVTSKVSSWTCIEPDKVLFEKLVKEGDTWRNKDLYQFSNAVLEAQTEQYDTILYIDVIEHIEKDGEELVRAYQALRPGGSLIVLVPAFNFLYSPFDQSIGHFRRYDKRMLTAIVPQQMEIRELFYLDSLGFFSSVANKLVLKQPYPSQGQINFWDSYLVPIAKRLDP